MNRYELVLVLESDLDEPAIKSMTERVGEIVKTHGGTVEKEDHWGRRQLAYPIKKREYGIYVIMVISGDSGLVSDLSRQLRITDQVIRFLLVEKDKYAPDFKFYGRDDRSGRDRDNDKDRGRSRDFRSSGPRETDDDSSSADEAPSA